MERKINYIKRVKNIYLLIAFAPLFLMICFSSNVSAETMLSSATMDKNLLQNVYRCYKHEAIKSKFKDFTSFKGASSLMSKKASYKVKLITGVSSDRYRTNGRWLWFDRTEDISCKDFFLGTGQSTKEGVFGAFGKTGDIPGSKDEASKVSTFLENMGYKVTKSGNSECYKLSYTWSYVKFSRDSETNRVCKDGDKKMKLEKDNSGIKLDDAAKVTIKDDGKKACLSLTYYPTSNSTARKQVGCRELKDSETFNGEWLIGLVTKSCDGKTKCKVKDADSPTYTFNVMKDKANEVVESREDYSAELDGGYAKDSMEAIQYLSGGQYKDKDSIRIKGLELRLLYQDYLVGYYNVKVDCREGVSDQAYDGKTIDWFDTSSSSMKKCFYSTDEAKNTGNPVNSVDDNGFLTQTIKDMNALLKVIENLPKNYSQEEIDSTMENVVNAGLEVEGNDSGEVSTCASAGGAGSLGWIVCPVLEWLGDVSEGIYNEYVEPALQVSPKLFTEGDDATLKAWSTFRDIANVIFVIVLLIVIFSQLTGVGIDNYGIKKILPKLVVMAVLVNLSYALCILAVDVSNILGNGFQSMFNGMSQQLSSSVPQQYTITTDQGTSEPIDAGAITGLTGVGILGMIVVAGVAIWASPAILISLLVAAIGIAVSIFFLFILLSAREAAILVMVIMSPLAVVMYVLPNTKNLFDRWLKMFEGLLFVYPICGLLVGAGGYVSRLLIVTGATSGDFIWSFMAMVVSIVPIFFIPTVLKGAFSAMGKMGGTLAGLGASAAAGAKRYTRARGGEIATKVGGTDTYRGLRNSIAMHSLSSRRRARAASDATALAIEKEERRRLSDKDTMKARIDSARAAEVAKAREEAVGQRLSLMQSNGIMMDGEKDPRAFTVANAEARMRQLEEVAKTNELDKKQQSELAALARGMSGMKGGGGALGKVVRDAKGANGAGANENFMKAMGEIYAQDSTVKSKMDEKDAGAAAYTEQFMPNNGGGNNGSFSDYQGTDQYNKDLNNRIKTHEAGLNQGGTAATEYLNRMSDEDVMKFAGDSQRLNKLEDNSIRSSLEGRAEGIKAKKASSGGGTVTPKPSTGGSSILTGSAASDAFKSGRSSGEIHLPH